MLGSPEEPAFADEAPVAHQASNRGRRDLSRPPRPARELRRFRAGAFRRVGMGPADRGEQSVEEGPPVVASESGPPPAGEGDRLDPGPFVERLRFLRPQVPGVREVVEVDPVGVRREQGGEGGIRRPRGHRPQGRDALGPSPPPDRARRVEHRPARDGAPGGLVAEDETVPPHPDEGLIDHDLDEPAGARGDVPAFEHRDPAGEGCGPRVHVHRGPVGERALFAREHAELRVEALRHPGGGLAAQPVAPPDVRASELGPREVDGAPFAVGSARRGPVLGVDAAHPDRGPGRGEDEAVPDRDFAREDRPGHHQARAPHGEGSVDREPEAGSRLDPRRPALRSEGGEVVPERLHAGAGRRRDGEHRRPFEAGALDQRPDPARDRGDLGVVHEVHLGHHRRPRVHAEEIEDREMLAGLGHGPVVGRDDEEGVVDRGDAGQHVADEALVARHVHEAEHRSVGPGVVGEAEVDAQAPLLLLRKPVGVDAGQGLDEDGLAVVNVARGGDQHLGKLRSVAAFDSVRPVERFRRR